MTEFKSDSSTARIRKNSAYTALRFAVYALAGVFFIPFLMREYGSGTYGLIALAGFLTQYVGLISDCVGRSVARFLNIALNQNDWQQANEIFTTAIAANFAAIFLQLPLFALGVWKLHWLIDFPTEIGTDFRILVICNIFVFFVSIIKGVFLTPIQAANRIDLNDKIEIFSQLLRLALLFALISGIGAKLWIIGAVDVGISLLFFSIGYAVSRRLIENKLVFKKKFITVRWVKPVLNMAGWTLVSALGAALFVRTDIWIINRFVNKEMAGIYAALLMWPNFIRQVGGHLASVINPVYMIDFAKNDLARMTRMCLMVNKLLGYIGALLVGFIFVFSDNILLYWLGTDYTQYAFLLKLMSVGIIITLSETVIWGVFPAINKTEYTGRANLTTGVLNVVLSLTLVYAGYGAYGVAVGTLISMIVKCSVWLPYRLSRELYFSYATFLFSNFVSLLIFTAIVAINSLLKQIFQGNLITDIVAFSFSIILIIPIVYKWGFTRSERQVLLKMANFSDNPRS